jgi:hypothetical protein
MLSKIPSWLLNWVVNSYTKSSFTLTPTLVQKSESNKLGTTPRCTLV